MAKLLVRLRSRLNQLREILFRRLFRARFRYDIFISYSHKDAEKYAANLKQQLSALDFSCFIDEEESPAGSLLDPTLAKALKKSAVLVLLATERALTRPYIISEFEKFAATKRTIVPINILETLTRNDETALSKDPWKIIKDRNLVWLDESDEAFAKQNPSPPIADGIDKLFKYMRRNTRVRTEIVGTAVMILIAAVGAGIVINGQAKELSRQVAIAEDARAETAKQLNIADKASQEAQWQLQIASGAKNEAERQRENARQASAEAEKQLRIASEAKAEADRQAERSRRLGYDSYMNLAQAAYERHDMARVDQLLSHYLPQAPGKNDLRSFYWYHLWHSSIREVWKVDDAQMMSQTAVAFSPDGRTLAIGGGDAKVRLWNLNNRKPFATLSGNSTAIYKLGFSFNGKKLAGLTGDRITVWDIEKQPEVTTIEGASESFAFSPDGKAIALLTDLGKVKLWNVETRQLIATLEGNSWPVHAIAFSPDGRMLATASANYMVQLWDLTTRKELEELKGNSDTIWSVAFSPDGSTLASASQTMVRLWDVKTRLEVATFETHKAGVIDGVRSIAFSPDGKVLAAGNLDSTVQLWNLGRKEEVAVLRVQAGTITSLAFSPNGMLASTSEAGPARLWDVSALQESDKLQGPVEAIAFSPDSTMFASLSDSSTIKLWDTSGRELRTLTDTSRWTIAFSPDGKTLASASSNGTVQLRDISTGRISSELIGHSGEVFSVAFSPDGRTLASAGEDGKTKLWDVASRRLLKTLAGHMGRAMSVAFSREGKVASGADNGVSIWDASTGRLLATFKRTSGVLKSVAFSPSGKMIAAPNGDSVELRDVRTGRLLGVLRGHSADVSSVSFSPDGNTLASASADYTVKLWDPYTFQEIAMLKIDTPFATSIAFSPDGKILASLGIGSIARLWKAPTKEEISAGLHK